MIFLWWGTQNITQHSRYAFSRAEQRQRIALLDKLEVLLLMLPSILLAFFATKTYCCLVLSSFTRVPMYFSAHLLSRWQSPVCTLSSLVFSLLFAIRSHDLLQQQTHIFSNLLLTADAPVETFPVALYIFLQIQLNMNLAFTTPSLYAQTLFLYFTCITSPAFPSCMLPFRYLIFIRNSGIHYVQTCSSSNLTSPWLGYTVLELREGNHENQPSLLVNSSYQGCIPLLTNPLTGQSLLSRSHGLVISLFPPFVILNFTHPKVFATKAVAHIQLLYRSPCLNIRSIWELLLVGALITCTRSCHQSTPVLGCMCLVIASFHRTKTSICEASSSSALIYYLFLTRSSEEDPYHNTTDVGLTTNPNP